jgi:hypothetical protein
MGNATIGLSIYGEKLLVDAVTAASPQPPSEARIARDPHYRRKLGDEAWNTGQWSISAHDISIERIEKSVGEMTEVYASILSKVENAAVLGVRTARITIGLFSLREFGDCFTLEPQLLSKIGSLGLELYIDAYGTTTESDEREVEELPPR